MELCHTLQEEKKHEGYEKTFDVMYTETEQRQKDATKYVFLNPNGIQPFLEMTLKTHKKNG